MLQYLTLPLSALEVTSILIGPAIGIEKMNPTARATTDIVIMLSIKGEFVLVLF